MDFFKTDLFSLSGRFLKNPVVHRSNVVDTGCFVLTNRSNFAYKKSVVSN